MCHGDTISPYHSCSKLIWTYKYNQHISFAQSGIPFDARHGCGSRTLWHIQETDHENSCISFDGPIS